MYYVFTSRVNIPGGGGYRILVPLDMALTTFHQRIIRGRPNPIKFAHHSITRQDYFRRETRSQEYLKKPMFFETLQLHLLESRLFIRHAEESYFEN